MAMKNVCCNWFIISERQCGLFSGILCRKKCKDTCNDTKAKPRLQGLTTQEVCGISSLARLTWLTILTILV